VSALLYTSELMFVAHLSGCHFTGNTVPEKTEDNSATSTAFHDSTFMPVMFLYRFSFSEGPNSWLPWLSQVCSLWQTWNRKT